MDISILSINFLTILSWAGVVVSVLWIIRNLHHRGMLSEGMGLKETARVFAAYPIKKPLILLIICLAFLIAKVMM